MRTCSRRWLARNTSWITMATANSFVTCKKFWKVWKINRWQSTPWVFVKAVLNILTCRKWTPGKTVISLGKERGLNCFIKTWRKNFGAGKVETLEILFIREWILPSCFTDCAAFVNESSNADAMSNFIILFMVTMFFFLSPKNSARLGSAKQTEILTS